MAGHLLMGIDVGTYSSKGVLCTPAGDILAQCQVEHGLSFPRPGWAEHDADKVWWSDLCVISRALLSNADVRGNDIAALAVSALGADVVPLDARGQALRPAILYGIDTRAEAEIAELEARYGPQAIAELSGTHLSAQSIGPKILWLRRHEPHIYRKTRYLCSASSFLVFRLCGAYVLDPTTAAFYDPLFDLRARDWCDRYAEDILDKVPLPQIAWPNEMAGQVTPQAADDTGLRPGTPVTVGTLDAAAESLSVAVFDVGDMMAMYGTTACLFLVLDEYMTNPSLWLIPYVLPGRYTLVGGMATTGAMTRWFRDQFAQAEVAAEASGGPNAYAALTAEAAAVPPGSEGLVLLPYFSGERTPLNDPQARGVIAGLSLAHGRGHLYRAILEATAYGIAHNVEVMRSSGAVPERVVAVGGGAKSDLLLQIVSDVTGLEQELPERTVGASYGDAALAGLAIGQLSLSDLRSNWVHMVRRFAPDTGRHELYRAFYRVYRDLYPHTRDDVHTLVRLGSVDERA